MTQPGSHATRRSDPAPLDDEVLRTYLTTFYGWGDYQAPFWFVGMEEGGGDNPDQVARKLGTWVARGRREVDDFHGFEGQTGASSEWFRPNAPLQPTWRKLIRLLLVAKGEEATIDRIRAYQAGQLGRTGGENCLLELLPLPSPSTSTWIYGTHSRLTELRDRDTYKRRVAPIRAAALRARVGQHRPRVVIFYGLQYRMWWEQIAAASFAPTERGGLYALATPQTLFIMIKGPTTPGITNEYFVQAGEFVQRHLGGAGTAGETLNR